MCSHGCVIGKDVKFCVFDRTMDAHLVAAVKVEATAYGGWSMVGNLTTYLANSP